MSSVQERLQLKRVPLDTWTIREQLGLASAVVKSGDQNWMSVSRSLKTIGDPTRPPDWYSQKSCAAQYGVLLEHVETPKRKKRSSEGVAESPQESILKKLTLDRIAEIQKSVQELTQQYNTIKAEVNEIKNPLTSEERIKELQEAVETENLLKEREAARKATWLREREERRARVERGWRGGDPAQQSTSTPSSPLLSSLLKSSPVVTTPQHISHPANVIETVSPSAGAPTLSMLLEKSSPSHENKHAAIEHIKNQLVQIEQQFIGTSPQVPAPAQTSLDIDDIEIKDEDVYAFRDVELEIAPVQNIHKGNQKQEKPQAKNDEEISVVEEKIEQKDESMEVDTTLSDTSKEESNIETSIQEPASNPEPSEPEEQSSIAFPEVKFPTTEIKVITPDENKEEVKEDSTEQATSEVTEETIEEEVAPPSVEENITITEVELETVSEVDEEQTNTQTENEKEEIAPIEEIQNETTTEVEIVPTEETVPKEQIVEENIEDKKTEVLQEHETSEPGNNVEPEPEKQVLNEETKETETNLDTDDDTPMEVIREEDKEGKPKRDYSRKKKFESRTCSGSESAELSAPDSPSATDQEKEHKIWKKAILLVYSRLSAHKYASLFHRPITDDQAPGYSIVVKRPMDLSTIRKNIDNGVIRSTVEFQRDVLLMLNNALMYNSSEHRVYQMTKEMYAEAQNEFNVLFAAQANADTGVELTTRQRRHEASRSRASKRSI